MDSDEEQVEKLKAWLKENGLSIVLGIVIGVGGLSGYRYWVHQQEMAAEQASQHYSKMIEALNSSNSAVLQEHARQLINEFSDIEYAQIARMALAKDHVSKEEYDQARDLLQQVVGSSAQEPSAFVARTRLAAVEMQMGELDAALASLSIEFPEAFAARVAELKGDIYVQQGKTAEAIYAYRVAQKSNPGPADPEFLRQKLTDRGGGRG